MKGLGVPVGEFILRIGMIIIALITLVVLIKYATVGELAMRSIDQATLIYGVTGAVNSLSAMEEGDVVLTLKHDFDVSIRCSGVCTIVTAAYNDQGTRMKETEKIDIIGDVEPVVLIKVDKITVKKEPGERVRITGEDAYTEFDEEFDLLEYPPKCINAHPEFISIIQKASQEFDVDQELIAAIIHAESSWRTNAKRYEPGFQIRYIETESKWMAYTSWIDKDDPGSMTINEWALQNPSRKEEISGFSSNEKILVAQTDISSSYGLMQVMYPTALLHCKDDVMQDAIGKRVTGPESLFDVELNIMCGTKVLRDKMDAYPESSRYDNDQAVSAYNAGKPDLSGEKNNQGYVAKVLGYQNAYESCGV